MDEHGLLGEDWNLEKGIVEKHIRAVNAAIISNGLNPTGRPPKNPAGDAPKPGKHSYGKALCTNFKEGRCNKLWAVRKIHQRIMQQLCRNPTAALLQQIRIRRKLAPNHRWILP